MIEFLLELDTQILLFLNGLNHELLDPFVKQFSARGMWLWMYICIAMVIIWKFGWKRGLIIIAAVGIAVGLSDMTCARVIRPFFQRLRPANLDNPISALVHIVDGYRAGQYGFPSCHAANTFALAVSTALIMRSKKYTAFIFVWAVLQCYSRIYLGVHFLGDLLVGGIIGSGYGFCAYYFTKRFSQEFNEKASTWPVIGIGIGTMVAIEAGVLFF